MDKGISWKWWMLVLSSGMKLYAVSVSRKMFDLKKTKLKKGKREISVGDIYIEAAWVSIPDSIWMKGIELCNTTVTNDK